MVILAINKYLAEYRNIDGIGSKGEGRLVTARYHCCVAMLLKLQANTIPEALTEQTTQKCGKSLKHLWMLT
jgi:hypothetical protein